MKIRWTLERGLVCGSHSLDPFLPCEFLYFQKYTSIFRKDSIRHFLNPFPFLLNVPRWGTHGTQNVALRSNPRFLKQLPNRTTHPFTGNGIHLDCEDLVMGVRKVNSSPFHGKCFDKVILACFVLISYSVCRALGLKTTIWNFENVHFEFVSARSGWYM